MDAYKLKIMLESRKDVYFRVNNMFIGVDYIDGLNEYTIRNGIFCVWFNRFEYSYKKDKLILYMNDSIVGYVYGESL